MYQCVENKGREEFVDYLGKEVEDFVKNLWAKNTLFEQDPFYMNRDFEENGGIPTESIRAKEIQANNEAVMEFLKAERKVMPREWSRPLFVDSMAVVEEDDFLQTVFERYQSRIDRDMDDKLVKLVRQAKTAGWKLIRLFDAVEELFNKDVKAMENIIQSKKSKHDAEAVLRFAGDCVGRIVTLVEIDKYAVENAQTYNLEVDTVDMAKLDGTYVFINSIKQVARASDLGLTRFVTRRAEVAQKLETFQTYSGWYWTSNPSYSGYAARAAASQALGIAIVRTPVFVHEQCNKAITTNQLSVLKRYTHHVMTTSLAVDTKNYERLDTKRGLEELFMNKCRVKYSLDDISEAMWGFIMDHGSKPHSRLLYANHFLRGLMEYVVYDPTRKTFLRITALARMAKGTSRMAKSMKAGLAKGYSIPDAYWYASGLNASKDDRVKSPARRANRKKTGVMSH